MKNHTFLCQTMLLVFPMNALESRNTRYKTPKTLLENKSPNIKESQNIVHAELIFNIK